MSMRTIPIALLAFTLAMCASQIASAQIKSPGRHPSYGVELEGHLVFQWTNDEWVNDDGLGLGMRASIPVIDNGPVSTINNNFAVTFGLDWAHFGDCRFDACDSDEFWVPVAMQWNFFLSPVVSLFPELGIAIQHSRFNWDGPVPGGGCVVRGINYCGGDDSDTDLELVLWLGARFTLAESFALTVRLGTPSILLGAAFFL